MGELKIGDFVSVLRISWMRGTIKIPGRVVAKGLGSFTVEAMQKPFDDQGHMLLTLANDAMGRTWE